MLASYKSIIGIAIIHCEKISGVGEMNAPTTNDPTMTILRLLRKNSDVKNPIFAKTNTIIGNSNTNPNGNTNEITNDRYCPTENIGIKLSVENPMKKATAVGNTKK